MSDHEIKNLDLIENNFNDEYFIRPQSVADVHPLDNYIRKSKVAS